MTRLRQSRSCLGSTGTPLRDTEPRCGKSCRCSAGPSGVVGGTLLRIGNPGAPKSERLGRHAAQPGSGALGFSAGLAAQGPTAGCAVRADGGRPHPPRPFGTPSRRPDHRRRGRVDCGGDNRRRDRELPPERRKTAHERSGHRASKHRSVQPACLALGLERGESLASGSKMRDTDRGRHRQTGDFGKVLVMCEVNHLARPGQLREHTKAGA